MKAQNNTIAMFDSGIGGLISLRLLQEKMQNGNFIYIADNKNLPYGSKTPEQINKYSYDIVAHLMQVHKPKLILIPCNTSSAISYKNLCSSFPNIQIIDIISPFISQIDFSNKNVCVIATQATVQSNVFKKSIISNYNNANVLQIACPDLVALIENGSDKAQIKLKMLEYLHNTECDYLIYGCTHYPYVHDIVQEIMPPKTQFVNPAHYMVDKVCQLYSNKIETSIGLTRYYNTGCPDQFRLSAQKLTGDDFISTKIYL